MINLHYLLLKILGGILTNSSKKNIEDEIEILKSKSLVEETVIALGLNLQFHTKKNGISQFLDDNLGMNTQFYEVENYNNPPLKINFFISDTILYKTNAQFIVTVNSLNKFTFSESEDKPSKKYTFGEKISTDFGDLIITPNIDFKQNGLIGENIIVSIISMKDLVNSYVMRIAIQPKSEFSSVLNLSVTDAVREKAENFLNELVNRYNQRSILLKDQLTKNTSDFVDKRLEIISTELSNVDLTAETLKTRYRISDAASETGLNLETGRQLRIKSLKLLLS